MHIYYTWKKIASDPDTIYNFNYGIYIFTGFWKHEFSHKWQNVIFKTYQAVLAFLYAVTISLFGVDAYYVYRDVQKIYFNMTSSVLVLVTLTKIILLRTELNGVEVLSDQLKHNLYLEAVGVSVEDKEILKKKANDLLMITKLFYFILHVLYPLRLLADIAFGTRTYIIPIPFKDRLDQYYEVVYGIQQLSILHFLVTVIAHDMFIYGIIIRLIGHYEILQKNFLKIKNLYPRRNFEKYVPGYSDVEEQKTEIRDVLLGKRKNSETVQKIVNDCEYSKKIKASWMENRHERENKVFKLLTECIRHHQLLLRQIDNFGRIYSKPFMIQAIGAVLLIGIVSLYILVISREITVLLAQQVLYLVTTMMNIFYLCSFGTDITFKSRETGDALYDTPWYEMDVRNKNTIFFILKILNKGPEFKCGGMVVISRNTYLKLLRMSYNMVAVLKNEY